MSSGFEDRVRAGFARQGLMATLGARLGAVAPGECTIAVPYSERITQQHGLFHGGVTATLADNAAGFAAYTLMAGDEQPLSVEFKVNLLAPARGDSLEARARVLRAGRRLKHVAVDIFALAGEEQTLVAVALATITSTRSVKERA
jgi:uncharacterized protein (TIGR00369 family)